MSLIRKYKITKRPPVKLLTALAGTITPAWRQDGELPQDVKDYFLSQVPMYKTKLQPSVVMHSTWDEIDRHRDRMAKSVFVFPIRYGKTTRLYVENEYGYEDSMVAFEPGYMYRFNDHNYHGLSNPNHANVILVTVSYD
jgi:hypothetical protein